MNTPNKDAAGTLSPSSISSLLKVSSVSGVSLSKNWNPPNHCSAAAPRRRTRSPPKDWFFPYEIIPSCSLTQIVIHVHGAFEHKLLSKRAQSLTFPLHPMSFFSRAQSLKFAPLCPSSRPGSGHTPPPVTHTKQTLQARGGIVGKPPAWACWCN